LGYQYLYSRQYDLAIKQHQKTLEMDPNYARAHEQLADTYFQKGMFDEAVAEYLKVRTLNRASPEDLAGLKESYATAGIKGFLRKQIDLATANPVKGASYPFYLALLYSRLGEKDKAFEWLDKAYAAHTFSLVHVREEVGFDNVRSDARFADLVRRVGLPQ